MITYGDSFLRLDYSDFFSSFHSSEKLGMMSVFENRNQFGKSDIVVKDGLVVQYNKIESTEEMRWINYGATILRRESVDYIPENTAVDEMQFYGKLIDLRQLAAFETANRFYEIGSKAGLADFELFVTRNPELFN